LQRSPRIIPNVEPELSAGIQAVLERDGLNIITSADIKAVQRNENKAQVTLTAPDGEKSLTADQLLVATGRAPNTDQLQLDKVGVETDKRGYIKVDHAFQTSVPGIWALGDVTGGAMFTHRSWHDGFLLARHFFKGETISTQDRLIPYAIFTDPEIAAVGLGEEAAREKGHTVKILSQPFKYVARAMAMAEEDGLIKLIVDEKTDALLGAHIFGPSAGELIHELAAVIRFGGKLFDLQDMLHIHPTLAEGINSAALS